MDREIDREFSKAIEIGQANKEIITLAHNWCAHLSVESHGGVGMVEQATGLPIGMRRIVCPYARAAGMAGMDMKHIAIDFYERNCADCKDRKPVRLPNLLQLVQEKARAEQAQAERAQRAAQIEAAGVESRTARRRVFAHSRLRAEGPVFHGGQR